MTTSPRTLAVALLGVAACLGACAERPAIARGHELLHVVLVKLKDPSRADELMRDTRAAIDAADIDLSLTPGRHADFGRPEVTADYDAAFIMRFPNDAEYQRYLASPEHTALVKRWMPESVSLRVFDIRPAGPDPSAAPRK